MMTRTTCPTRGRRPRGPTVGIPGQPTGRAPSGGRSGSIGEPGLERRVIIVGAWSSLATFSVILTFTEITDGFTRSTIVGEAHRVSTLHFVVDLRHAPGW